MSGADQRFQAGCRIIYFILALLLCVSCCSGARAEQQDVNLLYNADFSQLDEDGLPDGWFTDAWKADAGYTSFSADPDPEAPGGGNVVCIHNFGPNDARFVQEIDVEPESLYRFSAYVKADSVTEGLGANISVEGLYSFSESFYDTAGEWEHIVWYGETGEDQYGITLFLRVGGYSGESTGKAWFAQPEFIQVDSLPDDVVAAKWYRETAYDSSDDDDFDDSDEVPSAAWPWLLLIGLVYLGVWYTAGSSRGSHSLSDSKADLRVRILFFAGLMLAVAIRMVLSSRVPGYTVDVNCFLSWGYTMTANGPVAFYQNTGFCDYPPAYTYILGLNSVLSSLLSGGNEQIIRVIFRFFPCLSDVLACLLIRRFAFRNTDSKNTRSLMAVLLLFAFNPATALNSAAWGQMDSVLCILILAVAVFAAEGKWIFALPFYMLAVLVKPQALMLGFLGVTAAVISWIKQPESRKQILIGLGLSIAVAVAVILPFGIQQPFGWLISLYGETLGSYPRVTLNAANLYYLLGANWALCTGSNSLAPALLALGTAGFGVFWFRRSRDTLHLYWIETAVSAFFTLCFIFCAIIGASWNLTGIAAMVFIILLVLVLYIRKGDLKFLPYLGALLFILLFSFGLKMHERYIFPALFLLPLAYVLIRDKRILILLAGLSFTAFLNEGIVLDNCIRLGSSMGHLNNDTIPLADILSLLNVLLSAYAVKIGVDLLFGNIRLIKKKESFVPSISDRYPSDNRLHWKRIDTLLLSLILAVYSLITFTTLGSAKAPQNAWSSSSYEENVILDLGERQDSFSMLYFARVSHYDFSVAVSDDGLNWSDEHYAQMAEGQCWKWKYLTESWTSDNVTRSYDTSGSLNGVFSLEGRYVRITSHQIGLTLCEVLFRDGNGRILPVSVSGRFMGDPESELYSDPAALIDEQDTLEGLPDLFSSSEEIAQPSWWNSTYFDEIYHARTAYEFVTASRPYETSHPPLGKVLMSFGVMIFGMTPFGWRFAGAFAGVIMLAGMYLTGKQLTKKTSGGVVACLLMALDCMHMTQTQIATIDSFPVLFIIFSYFFMLRFIQTDLLKCHKSRILTDLGLSGLFMGLSIASKWIGIYAGAGLAVLFFWHCFRTVAHEKRATGKSASSDDPSVSSSAGAWKTVLSLCCWCLLFFILIPVLIYLVSYLPYFAYNKGIRTLPTYLKAVWNSQLNMFNYHATPGLGMDHQFYSPWYQWPVNGKPMFYATKQYLSGDRLYSIFCFGNPAIWYPALATVLWCAVRWCMDRFCDRSGTPLTADGIIQGVHRSFQSRAGRESSPSEVHCDKPSGYCFRLCNPASDANVIFILIGLLAQYLPWVLVPRGTYIYHYFASTPFLILAIVLLVNRIGEKNRRLSLILSILWILAAAVFFILLFPYISGITASTDWLNIGKSLLKIWY